MDDRVKLSVAQPLDQEPWVRLPSGRDLEGWGHEEEVCYNQQRRQMQKYNFYMNAFDFLSANGIQRDYHEYGCHRGRTFRMALTEARRHSLDQMRFLAFDSFEGLPEAETPTGVKLWKAGALCTPDEYFREIVREHGIYTENCHLFKGFFKNTLNRELQEELRSGERKASLVCVDCDLYESAVPVFNFIEPFLQEGTLIYVDDYFVGYRGSCNKGVSKAFAEFQTVSSFKFETHMQIGWWGRSFVTYQ